ncbi:hypothetical protein JOF53_006611 [Crossiella equi]|uniref:Intein C-terminal splicing domain-containing protein n=1 Tax=Crossiella equi TaxID=130796 RepID=A0ABS5AMD3_9PSEU|nr:hypothetical protein [Crossiella equi]MBP2477739.1 hypothetical protein [Crossiella equi]
MAANHVYTSRIQTFNLTVDTVHTYYVLAGATPVLVHNVEGCPEIPGSAGSWVEARDKARELAGLGDDAVPYSSEVGPHKGRLYVGMQSPDGTSGWRIDYDPQDSSKSFHVNWWKNFDRTVKRSELGSEAQ